MDNEFANLIAKMDGVKGEQLKKAQRKALRAVGDIVKTAIVEHAPERVSDTPSGTALAPGALKADIRARVHIAADEKMATDTSRVTIGPGKATAHVARWVENGHANSKAVKGAKNTPAHPFIRPAADAVKQTTIDEYEAIMTAEIQKVMNA
jgi:HK97 gp10 family phage protein